MTTFMELVDGGKFPELYDKWFGGQGVVPIRCRIASAAT
jgi:hypothetical protein